MFGMGPPLTWSRDGQAPATGGGFRKGNLQGEPGSFRTGHDDNRSQEPPKGPPMTEKQLVRLHEAIKEVTLKIQRFQDRNLGEQNTKASLFEPVLEALGWD